MSISPDVHRPDWMTLRVPSAWSVVVDRLQSGFRARIRREDNSVAFSAEGKSREEALRQLQSLVEQSIAMPDESPYEHLLTEIHHVVTVDLSARFVDLDVNFDGRWAIVGPAFEPRPKEPVAPGWLLVQGGEPRIVGEPGFRPHLVRWLNTETLVIAGVQDGGQAVWLVDTSGRISEHFWIPGFSMDMLVNSTRVAMFYADERAYLHPRNEMPMVVVEDRVAVFDYHGRFTAGYPSLGLASPGAANRSTMASTDPLECVAACWMMPDVVAFLGDTDPVLVAMDIRSPNERAIPIPAHMAAFPDAMTIYGDSVITMAHGEVWAVRLSGPGPARLLHFDPAVRGRGHARSDGSIIQPLPGGYRQIRFRAG